MLLLCTRTLKKLVVKRETRDEQSQLTRAFEVNSTVCIAELFMGVETHRVAAALADMLEKNRTLQSLTIWSQGPPEPDLERLARGFKNDVLVHLSFTGCVNGETVRVMPQLLRRNRCLLNRAAKYALGVSSDADSKVALAKLAGRDSLIRTLVGVSGETKAECKQLVEDRAREISATGDNA